MVSSTPSCDAFLSLFVSDLEVASSHMRKVFATDPVEGASGCPAPHPFAARGPVVFCIGGLRVALYQADLRATHPGDVGIGVVDSLEALDEALARGRLVGAPVLRSMQPLQDDSPSQFGVMMLPSRHFFELLSRHSTREQ